MYAHDAKMTNAMRAWRLRLAAWVAIALAFASMAALPAQVAVAAPASAGEVEVTVRVVGVDDANADEPTAQAWVPESQLALPEGSVAWDALKALLDEAGCTYDAQDSEYGVFVQSVTSPDGMMLENTSSEPYSFWAFLVNGEMAAEGVSSYVLQDGDTVELAYYPGGEAPAHEPMPIADEPASEPADDAEADAPADGKTDEGGPNMTLVAGGVAVVVVIAVAAFVLVRARSKR